MYNIGLIGKARSGKDTAAAHLVRNYAYTRLAFADPLKEMALRVNPIIGAHCDDGSCHAVTEHLDDVVCLHGWEYAKDNYPEVRRILQQVGQVQRDADPDYWVDILLRKVDAAERWNLPVVVSDVRYRNEADALRTRGFKLIRLVRPAGRTLGMTAQHPSETDLDDVAADFQISNTGTVEDLCAHITQLVR